MTIFYEPAPTFWPPSRRLVPIVLGLSVTTGIGIPLAFGWITESSANVWTFLFSSILFTIKAILFFWMRYEMCRPSRVLTVFGAALVDFFAGLILFSLIFGVTFFVFFLYARNGHVISNNFRLANRLAIDGAGVYILITGAVVAWEMHKAGPQMNVHVPEESPS